MPLQSGFIRKFEISQNHAENFFHGLFSLFFMDFVPKSHLDVLGMWEIVFRGGVISKKKKFLAWHSWPKQSKIGGPKSKPCKISPVTAFSVIFRIFPGAFHIFTTLYVVLRS